MGGDDGDDENERFSKWVMLCKIVMIMVGWRVERQLMKISQTEMVIGDVLSMSRPFW